MATRSSKKKMLLQQLDILQTPILQPRSSSDMSTSPDNAEIGKKKVFSCPKQPIPGSYTSDLSFFGLSEPRISRKRPFREDLDTVKEEGEPAHIMVYVRLRPMSRTEKDAGARSCVRIVNKRDVYLTEIALDTDYLRLKRLKGRHFIFDAAFPDMTGQLEVYNRSTAELVEGVLQGRNGSVFCYGATGAGKTHTMLGSMENPGVMVLALKDLFTKLREKCKEGHYVVRLSYLEVYNETVRDLLSPGRPLVLREDSKQGIIAAGLTWIQAYSDNEVMALLQQGNRNRTTEPTRANETSSRSHAILQVTVEYKTQQESHWVSRTGKLSLIDLAGSERALATDQRTIRSLEGANINRSLLALSSCINALVEGKKHIPFRNSKLTQLLKDSLGGSCQTSMIANVSPSHLTFGETQNTLHWANRAKQIQIEGCEASEEIQPPELSTEQTKLLLEVQKENQQLRLQLARMQQKLLVMETKLLATDPTTPKYQSEEYQEQTLIGGLQRKVRALEKERDDKDQIIRKLSENSHYPALVTPLTNRRSKLDQENVATVASVAGTNRIMTRSVTADKGLATRIPITDGRCGSAVTPCARRIKIDSSGMNAHLQTQTLRRTARTVVTKETQKAATLKGHHEQSNAMAGMTMINARHLSRIPQPPQSAALTCSSLPKTPVKNIKSVASPGGKLVSCRDGDGRNGGNGLKRTFWDITNANSPSASLARSTRSNTAATPSMLLQPGFLGGRCRKLV